MKLASPTDITLQITLREVQRAQARIDSLGKAADLSTQLMQDLEPVYVECDPDGRPQRVERDFAENVVSRAREVRQLLHQAAVTIGPAPVIADSEKVEQFNANAQELRLVSREWAALAANEAKTATPAPTSEPLERWEQALNESWAELEQLHGRILQLAALLQVGVLSLQAGLLVQADEAGLVLKETPSGLEFAPLLEDEDPEQPMTSDPLSPNLEEPTWRRLPRLSRGEEPLGSDALAKLVGGGCTKKQARALYSKLRNKIVPGTPGDVIRGKDGVYGRVS